MADVLDCSYDNGEDQSLVGSKQLEDYWFELHTGHAHFHLRIAECTGCLPLREAMEKNQIVVFNWLFDMAFQPRKIPTRWHAQLMQSLNSGNVEIADREMRAHVRYGMEELVRRRNTYRSLDKGMAERSMLNSQHLAGR